FVGGSVQKLRDVVERLGDFPGNPGLSEREADGEVTPLEGPQGSQQLSRIEVAVGGLMVWHRGVPGRSAMKESTLQELRGASLNGIHWHGRRQEHDWESACACSKTGMAMHYLCQKV